MSDKLALPGLSRFLSVSEACQYLGISRMTLLQAEERQLLRSSRTPGGHRRYNYDDLVRYMATYGVATTNFEDKLPATPLGDTAKFAQFLSLESALRQIILLLQVEMGGAFLFSESRRQLVLNTSFGIPRWLLNRDVTVGLEGVSGKVLTNLQPLVFNSADSELPLVESARGQGLCVPLIAQQEKLGTLQIYSTQRQNFFPSEINIFATFGIFYSMLLINKLLFQNYQDSAQQL